MGRKILPLFALLTVLLSGCANQSRKPSVRVVTRVEVTCIRDGELLQRQYTDAEKMQSLLNYLRLLEPRGTASIDPELTLGNAYEITLHFSRGAPTVYYQRSERFLSKNRHPWQKVDSRLSGELYPILEELT